MLIKSFAINGLYGYKSYKLKFKNNTLIIVGENGAGKTTVLRILYYLLTAQWSSLFMYDFKSLILKINNEEIKIQRPRISTNISFRHSFREFPLSFRDKVQEIYNDEQDIYSPRIIQLCEQFDIPINYFRNVLERYEHSEETLFENFDDSFDEEKYTSLLRKVLAKTHVIYLPTYRRIEQELSSIIKNFDYDEVRRSRRRPSILRQRQRNHIELIEFGMNDVKQSINNMLGELKDFARESLNSLTLAYLGDVVEKKYDDVDEEQIKEATDDTIHNILNRIDSKILSENSKKLLSKTIENVKNEEELDAYSKVVCHYFTKLLNFQQELEAKEENIRKFCELCNSYMEDKVFEYTSSSFSFNIIAKYGKKTKNVKLQHLSSGEKQIVSLFSHLYLVGHKKFFVMIDEPELSLSVPWQRQFLVDIANGDYCSGIFAVTHSPFIYENELDEYAHGLGEFLTHEA